MTHIKPIQEPTKKTRILNRLVYVSLFIATVALGIILKWSFADTNVLTVNNEPFPTRSVRQTPRANGVVILDIDYCKHSSVEGSVRPSFVGEGGEYLLPESHEQFSVGCDRIEIPILIPKSLPPGDYVLKFVVTYHLNPIKQNVTMEFETREFHVDPDSLVQPIVRSDYEL